MVGYANDWTVEMPYNPFGAVVFIMTQHRLPSYFVMRVKEPDQFTVTQWNNI